MKATGYSYTIFAAGDSEVYREAAAPLSSALEQVIPHHGKPLPSPLALPRDARNDPATVGVLVVGLILFVAKDITKLAVTLMCIQSLLSQGSMLCWRKSTVD